MYLQINYVYWVFHVMFVILTIPCDSGKICQYMCLPLRRRHLAVFEILTISPIPWSYYITGIIPIVSYVQHANIPAE